MHGSVTGEPLHGDHIADKFLVYGENNRRNLVGLGNDSSQIEVCGAPYLDRRPIQAGKLHVSLKQRLCFREDKPMVLVATSGPGHCTSERHFQSLVEAVMRLSAKMSEVNFVAKLHRKDRVEFYEVPHKNVPDSRLHVIADGRSGFPRDIFDWLQGCSLLLTTVSTVGIEAMLMDVPVISMDFAGEFKKVDFVEANTTIHVQSEQELEEAARMALERPETLLGVKRRAEEFLKDSFGALDGNSALRCAIAISHLISHAVPSR